MSNEKILKFKWHEQKARANLKKHRVSFEEAKSVFNDLHARLIMDPDHSIDEDRFILLGASERLQLLVVCHCYRKNDSVIRLISVRRASSYEHAIYEEHRK